MSLEKSEAKEVIEDGYREGNAMPSQTVPSRKRLLVGVPMTGLIRSEWVIARYGQVIPCNWSQTDAIRWLNNWSPLDFLVADARNIVATQCVEMNFDWLFFIDHDVVLAPDTIIRMNERMIKEEVPIWGGLYFTKSRPAEPLVYRGRGNGYFANWELGDEVWVDGLPMGCTMIHSSILKVLYDTSEYYDLPGIKAKKIFETPAKVWFSPDRRSWTTATGTEDLEFCSRIMREEVFKKAGWPEYEGKEFPFLIDTSIFCRHIDFDGVQYPHMGEELEFVNLEEEDNGNKTDISKVT